MPRLHVETLLDIGDLDKATLLAAFYNAASQNARGELDPNGAPGHVMTREEAQKIIDARTHAHGWRSDFDYLNGRLLKVDIGGELLDPRLFDNHYGEGAANRVIATITRPTHLRYAKDRALVYARLGKVELALASLTSDLMKHPATANHAALELGMKLYVDGHLSTSQQMVEWIEGFA